MMRRCGVVLIVAVIWSTFLTGSWAQQAPLACDSNAAQNCINLASQGLSATGCNWFTLTPALYTCINNAVAGCSTAEQVVWLNLVWEYNATLYGNNCFAACQNENARSQAIASCYAQNKPETVIASIVAAPPNTVTSQSPSCVQLSALNSCLTAATQGCSALITIVYNRISVIPGVSTAYMLCGVTPFMAATTNAPVYLLTNQASTTAGPPDNSISYVYIVAGSILIAAAVSLIIAMILLSIHRRNAASRKPLLQNNYAPTTTVYQENYGAQGVLQNADYSGSPQYRPTTYRTMQI